MNICQALHLKMSPKHFTMATIVLFFALPNVLVMQVSLENLSTAYLPYRYHWKIPVPRSSDYPPLPPIAFAMQVSLENPSATKQWPPPPFTKCTCHAGNWIIPVPQNNDTPHPPYQIYLTCRYHWRVPVPPKQLTPSYPPPPHLLSHLDGLLTAWQCTHHVCVVGESHCHKAIPGAVSQSSQLKAHLRCVGLPGHDVFALWLPASLRLSVTPLALATLIGVDRSCDLSRGHIC